MATFKDFEAAASRLRNLILVGQKNAALLDKYGALQPFFSEWCQHMDVEERLLRLGRRKFRIRKNIIQFRGSITGCWFEFDKTRSTGRWWKDVEKKDARTK